MVKIVIAEDEFLVADMLVLTLEEAGYDVRSAPHGAGALELIRAERPDLLITDFMMPLMTGLELAEALRADPATQAIPIILVSGAQGWIGRGRADLFDRVLDKPYSLTEIVDVAAALLDGQGTVTP
jgi:CheY-like chemotaxis protein